MTKRPLPGAFEAMDRARAAQSELDELGIRLNYFSSLRDAAIHEASLNGMTYRLIGEGLGITHTRVEQIMNRHGDYFA